MDTTKYQIGDIIHVRVDDELPEPNHDLPDGEGWSGIVVDVDKDGDPEVAWLSQSTTPLKGRSPMIETWDTSTNRIQPGYDSHVKLLKRATYQEVEVGG